MDGGDNSQEKSLPIQFMRNPRAFRQFKNPPQPHMCIQDSVKDTQEKLYINVLKWQKIASPKHFTDPIPLYGGMQVPQRCAPNNTKPPLNVFAVMVNPEILKINGKNAINPVDRDALVNLLCDFVEAMNPGLHLTRNPVILKDRDLAGELKDVWLAIQTKREREKGQNQDFMYKVYDIDGVRDGSQDIDHITNINEPQNDVEMLTAIKSKETNKDTAQVSDFNVQEQDYYNQDYKQIMYNDNMQVGDYQTNANNFSNTNYINGDSYQQGQSSGWDTFSKRDIRCKFYKVDKSVLKHYQNNKESNNFFPVFENKPFEAERDQEITTEEKLLEPLQNLTLSQNDSDSKVGQVKSLL